MATLFKHIQDPVPFEGPVAARIPLPAVAVLRRALDKDRAARFDNSAAMAEALRDAQRTIGRCTTEVPELVGRIDEHRDALEEHGVDYQAAGLGA